MTNIYYNKFTLRTTFFLIPLLFILCFAQPACISKTVNQVNVAKIQTTKGEKIFPLGFYHVSHRRTSQQRLEALQDIAAAGFNIIHAGCGNLDDYNDFLDEAERLGVYVITEFNDIDYHLVVKKFANKAAVIGWNIADDAGDHKTKAQILDMQKQVKALDPRHYTYVSVSNWSKKWAEFADAGDLIGGQSYPIGYPFKNKPKGLPNTLIEVNHVFNIGQKEATKHGRPVIANIQVFKWDNKQLPTSKEVYNMTYQSLLAGVKGILFFAYDDGGENQIHANGKLWDLLKSVAPELNKLSPVLIDGTLTKLNTKNEQLLAGQWKYQNSLYVIVANTSQTKTIATSMTIPLKQGLVKTLFPGRPSGMSLRNGTLRGSVKPEDVHIYQISQK
jgi:hypothetical protein